GRHAPTATGRGRMGDGGRAPRRALGSRQRASGSPPAERLRGGRQVELSSLLDKLKLDHLEQQLAAVCEQAAARELDYPSFLREALATEWRGRSQRGIEARLRQARFPWAKTLEQFDFEFQSSLDRKQVRELSGSSWV